VRKQPKPESRAWLIRHNKTELAKTRQQVALAKTLHQFMLKQLQGTPAKESNAQSVGPARIKARVRQKVRQWRNRLLLHLCFRLLLPVWLKRQLKLYAKRLTDLSNGKSMRLPSS
jgi:hypothetical protein